jgi:hypothetical protein
MLSASFAPSASSLATSFGRLRQEACLEDIGFRHPRGLDRSVLLSLADGLLIWGHSPAVCLAEVRPSLDLRGP